MESLRQEHNLEYPHEFLFGRAKGKPSESRERYGITGKGKAGLIMSHAVHALREFLRTKRPMFASFQAEQPSRQRAYEHLTRKMVKESGAGTGRSEYRAFRNMADPREFHLVHHAVADSPMYREMYPEMEEIGAGEKVGASNEAQGFSNDPQRKTPAPAIDAPEPARDLQYVSPGMAILMELRARRQAGQAGGTQQGYANMGPGRKILFELRARRGGGAPGTPGRGGYGFANEPPEPGNPPGPEAEYLGHGPTTEGQYGISFKTPEGEQHLGVKGMKEIERGPAGHLMHVTFYNGSAATLRMPEEHRKEVFRQLLSRAPKPANWQISKTGKLVNMEEVARKREQMRQEAQAEAAARRMPAVTPTGTPAKPKRPAKDALNFQMPTIPMTGIGPAARVATSVRDVVSEDFRNQVVPKLMEKHGFTPEADAGLAHEAERGVGNRIGWALNAFHRKSDWSGGKRTNEQTDLVPAVYATMLKDLENWDPATQTRKVKNAETGEVTQAPLDFQHFLDRVTDRTVRQLKGEDLPENPTIEHDPDEVADDFLKQFTAGREPGEAKAAKAILDGLRKGVIGYDEPATPLNLIYHPDMPAEFRSVHKIGPLFNRLVDEAEQYHRENGENPLLPPMSTRSTEGEDEDSAGGGSITAPVTQEDLERRRGESTALEDEKRKDLADLWFGAHLDKAGEEVYQARTGGQPLDRLRKKYGDEAVDERSKAIDDLAPAFNKYVKSGYDMSQVGMEDLPKLTTPAKNILPIKRAANRDELKFLKEFTAGMEPEEKQAAETLYYARRNGLRSEDLRGHEEVPQNYRSGRGYERGLAPLSRRMSVAARQFTQRTGKDVWSKIKPTFTERTIRQIYIPEKEHHPAIETFMRRKLSEAGLPLVGMKVLTQTMMGNAMPRRLWQDPELKQLAEERHAANLAKAGRYVGGTIKSAETVVRQYYELFKQWLPEYFESVGCPDLAKAYQDKRETRSARQKRAIQVTRGVIAPQTAEERARKRKAEVLASERAAAALHKRKAIDPKSLNLPGVTSALRDAFSAGRFTSGRASEQTTAAMRMIGGRLDHQTITEQLRNDRNLQQLLALPGFFRQLKASRSPIATLSNLNNFWFVRVLPVVKQASPALYGLLTMNPRTFKKDYYPLSQTPEETGKE